VATLKERVATRDSPSRVIVSFPLILNTFHHFFPFVSSSFGFSGHIDPRRACTSFHGKKGLKAQRLVVRKR
jgi:hypothetical protein